jgi:myo-inositol-1(or 4)-monophosphatase
MIIGFEDKRKVLYDTYMDQYLDFAKNLAYEAGKIIKDNFDTSVAVDTMELKEDSSPVTKVDREINQLVIQRVQEHFPGHGVLGEEADAGDGTEEYQWLCDPLDGTRPFILGVPCSTFMLALTTHGEVLVSVIYEPHFDKLYYAVKGEGAFCNGKPIHVSTKSLAEGNVLVSSGSYVYAEALREAGAKLDPVQGGGYKAIMVADGRGVAALRNGADFHDVGPAALIIEEAGGKVTGMRGEKMLYNAPITGMIMSNGADHDKLVAIMASRLQRD